MRTKLIKKKIEYLYDNKDEFFDNHDDDLVYDWRESSNMDWVLTDDGQVCRILHKGKFANGKEYVRTLLGSYPIRKSIQINGVIADDIYRFTKSAKTRKDRIDEKSPNGREIVFAKYVANGISPEQAYIRIFRTNDPSYSKNASSALLKTKRVKKLISEETKKMLGEVGIDEEYLLSKTKDIIDNYDVRDSDKLRALEMMMKIAGMFPNDKKTESLTVFQGFTRKQLQQIGGSDIKAIGHAEKDIS
jgi:16S rRNA U516 pseudouridylate synthase RsuA-like enzyme